MSGRRALGARLGMFWRVYLFGVLLLISVTLAIFGTGYVVARTPPPIVPAIAHVESIASRWPAPLEDKPALEAELAAVAQELGGELVIYGLDGRVIAGAGPHLAPLSAAQLAELKRNDLRDRGPRFTIYSSSYLPNREAPTAYIRAMVPMLAPVALRVAIFLAVILLALTLVSIPFARIITAPVVKLTQTAKALGAGDLSVRSGISRRDEVGVLAAALDEMADRVQRLLRNEKELLANVSHELRTPLARIRMALELAAEGDAEKVRRSLEDVQEDLEELEALVGNILTAARLDLASGRSAPGELPLHKQRVDPAELIARCAERFREAHAPRAITLEVEEGLPALEVDPVLVRRALDNLIDNARKYSDQAAGIDLRARRREGGVEVEVEDRGIGMEPADLERLFTPFFRSDRSRARGTGGVGLGLALAKRIAEAHGGSLLARSTPGTGTTMILRLPPAPPAS